MRLHFYLLSSDPCYMVFIIKSDLPWGLEDKSDLFQESILLRFVTL